MARSKTDMSTDTLKKLSIIGAMETPAAEDSALVERRYDDKLASLIDAGLAYWSHTSRTSENIPNAVYNAIVGIMAEECAAEFGVEAPTVTDDTTGRQVSCGTKGMRDLRRHMAKGPSGAPTKATYY